jgi:hypothetical protein
MLAEEQKRFWLSRLFEEKSEQKNGSRARPKLNRTGGFFFENGAPPPPCARGPSDRRDLQARWRA